MVVRSTERYILQELTGGGGEMVFHSRTALANAQLAVPGQAVEIRYPHGRVGLVEKAVDGPKHDLARQRGNCREIDR
ncbi:KfrB domain-containing protein [Achromobacter mucicolens]|uniref:KfrB domain-containing protein n=1 Tax=Achromobacter mucicolens TaxID=1389922 RepID=UPI003AEF53EF